jgi:hypothetical protein
MQGMFDCDGDRAEYARKQVENFQARMKADEAPAKR